MEAPNLAEKINSYLHKLCVEIPTRRVGSQGNRDATDFFTSKLSKFGFQIDHILFECVDWQAQSINLIANNESFEAYISPYSLGVNKQAPLVTVNNVSELEAVQAKGKILLVRGDAANEPLMPKNFPFYNPDSHQHIVKLLENSGAIAIITATEQHPGLAGGKYPFAMIEDGDFNIPTVYMSAQEGLRLAKYTGQQVSLTIEATRIPSTGINPVARLGNFSGKKLIFTAHIDAKDDTPGALDNAAGVIVLLLLAERLQNYSGQLGIEIVAFNGEDHYSAAGEIAYLRKVGEQLQSAILAINLDGVGYKPAKIAYSLYNCPERLAAEIRDHFSHFSDMVEGEMWYQGDHTIFIQNNLSAVAITSDAILEMSTNITHTERDLPELVSPQKLNQTAQALAGLIKRINNLS
jgi:aminopeptidase YwaD